MRRRDFLENASATAITGLAATILPRRARAQDKGQVVVASYGGAYQDAQREIYFKPFEKETGIRVVDVPGFTIAKIQVMGKAGNMEWDLVPAVTTDVLVLSSQGLLEKIDYSAIDPKVLAGIDKNLQKPFSIASLWASSVIAYSTKAFPAGSPHPDRWADLWDVARFPGKRMLPAGDYVVNPIEPALLADGVPKDKLYPIDFDRAYKSLGRIRPDVVKWINTAAAIPQALTDGSAVVGLANAARIQDLIQQGAPIAFTWNEGILFNTTWAVPKGGPNSAGAMKLIEFALRPDRQAAFVKLQPSGPTNRDAFAFIPENERNRYPSFPDNLKKQVVLDAEWWAAKNGTKSNLEFNADLWRKWMVT